MADKHVHSGPNGSNNYLPDNPSIAVTYTIDGDIETITLTGPVQGESVAYVKTFTYSAPGIIASISDWVLS